MKSALVQLSFFTGGCFDNMFEHEPFPLYICIFIFRLRYTRYNQLAVHFQNLKRTELYLKM